MTRENNETVFSDGKARWLLENAEQLDEDERALLLAMAELDKDTGRELTDEERAALDKLAAKTQGFDPDDIQAAVQKMVKGKAKRKPVQDWPADIGRKFKRAR